MKNGIVKHDARASTVDHHHMPATVEDAAMRRVMVGYPRGVCDMCQRESVEVKHCGRPFKSANRIYRSWLIYRQQGDILARSKRRELEDWFAISTTYHFSENYEADRWRKMRGALICLVAFTDMLEVSYLLRLAQAVLADQHNWQQ